MREGRDTLSAKCRRFMRLPQQQRLLVLRAIVYIPLTMMGLRAMGFRRWKELVEHCLLGMSHPRALELTAQFETAACVTRAVRSAELHGPNEPNCLERSMVLWWLLRQEGIEGELHVGARKTESRFEAHAWVELGGRVINDSIDVHRHYARFDAPIAAAGADLR